MSEQYADDGTRNGNSRRTETTVSLGCGTLILIALIVLIFGGRVDLKPVERKLDRIEDRQRGIEQKLDEIAKKLEEKE